MVVQVSEDCVSLWYRGVKIKLNITVLEDNTERFVTFAVSLGGNASVDAGLVAIVL